MKVSEVGSRAFRRNSPAKALNPGPDGGLLSLKESDGHGRARVLKGDGVR